VLHALERLRAPRLLVLIAGFMYRYLFVVAAEVARMRTALGARGYRPRHALQAAALGRAATALFLRTYSRAERVHLAMVARGYRQAPRRLGTLALGRADALFAVALLAVLLPARVLAELAL
jgi:cobalt/nickel transport system permease protein